MGIRRVTEIDDRVPIRTALVSVYDKTGLDFLIPGLIRIIPEIEIISTGGTFQTIKEILGPAWGKNLSSISAYTGQPEMEGGLVKTLDYKIYLGILSENYNAAHRADLERAGAKPIDLVVVNLYPFSRVVSNPGSTPEDARGNIDIGGPCMLRAASKNFLRVLPVCEPSEYGTVIEELRQNGGTISLATRFSFARKGFGHTARYDADIDSYLGHATAEMVRSAFTIHNT